jgi:hypothetical protein
MKTLKTKVILSAVVLLFALVATIGSTFAWFTVSDSVEVETMELNVSTTDSLLIKVREAGETFATPSLLDATEYKTFIPIEDILASYADLADWRLTPVTVIDANYAGITGDSFNTLTTPNTDFDRSLTVGGGALANDEEGFVITLEFWVLSQGALGVPLILQDLSVENNGAAIQDGVETAVRLSVKAHDNVQAASQAFVFGLTNDYGFSYIENLPGYFEGAAVYDGGNALIGFNALDELTQGYSGSGSGVDVEALLHADTANAEFFKSDALADLANAYVDTDAEATQIYTLNQDTPTLVTVTIFVEGWAAGAINNIIAANFDISFKFALYIA